MADCPYLPGFEVVGRPAHSVSGRYSNPLPCRSCASRAASTNRADARTVRPAALDLLARIRSTISTESPARLPRSVSCPAQSSRAGSGSRRPGRIAYAPRRLPSCLFPPTRRCRAFGGVGLVPAGLVVMAGLVVAFRVWHPVADAGFGVDVGGVGGAVAELLAESPQVGAHLSAAALPGAVRHEARRAGGPGVSSGLAAAGYRSRPEGEEA